MVAGFLAMNLLFALAYMATGGVAGARPGSLLDAYAFSVETMATIGYGEMHPASPASHVLVILEAVVGLIVTVVGTDDTSLQSAHARKRYLDGDITCGRPPRDVLSTHDDGSTALDLQRFHAVIPTLPTDDFPYPLAAPTDDGATDPSSPEPPR